MFIRVFTALDYLLTIPAPTIEVSELVDFSVNFVVQSRVNSAAYWNAYPRWMANIKATLNEAVIGISSPQIDPHVLNLSELPSQS